MNINPMLLIDGYKADHRSQYPNGTTEVYSNFTPRKSRVEGVDKIVYFGLQSVIKDVLIDQFNQNFFSRNEDEVCNEYQQELELYLNMPFSVDHIRSLHRLGYLPLEIKSLPEGSLVPLQTPLMTLRNTVPDFFWLTNYLETVISSEMWKPSTSATMAYLFRKKFEYYADLTGASKEIIEFQGHDFSFRGMSDRFDAMKSGAGHLLSFRGTDTIPAIKFLRNYYNAQGFVGCSVPATEHSVMCAGDEFETVKRLIMETYPKGILSIVADSYDFWRFVTEFLPTLKSEIMAREGKVVVRPDTGVPHLVICGDPNGETEAERKGLVRCLYESFGGTVNSKGFIQVDSHVGAIYGDSIDLLEQHKILEGLYQNGFATDNVVLGIGSYTYQYVTRDTFGFVCKATNCTINGEDKAIFKNPKTGAWKKSHKGLLSVNEDFSVVQNCSREQEATGMLATVFKDGQLLVDESFETIRTRLQNQ